MGAYDILMERYKTLCSELGKDLVQHLIVVRRHMRTTEEKVWKQDAVTRRAAQGIKAPIDYLHDSEDENSEDEDSEDEHVVDKEDKADLEALALDYQLRNLYGAHRDSWSDVRLQHINLSEGQWVLHLAGVPVAKDGSLHPIADPDTLKYARFRELLQRFAAGQAFTREDK